MLSSRVEAWNHVAGIEIMLVTQTPSQASTSATSHWYLSQCMSKPPLHFRKSRFDVEITLVTGESEDSLPWHLFSTGGRSYRLIFPLGDAAEFLLNAQDIESALETAGPPSHHTCFLPCGH